MRDTIQVEARRAGAPLRCVRLGSWSLNPRFRHEFVLLLSFPAWCGIRSAFAIRRVLNTRNLEALKATDPQADRPSHCTQEP